MLKEKIKQIKVRLKAWNKDQFGDMQKKLSRIKMDLNKLEIEGDERKLSDQELMAPK